MKYIPKLQNGKTITQIPDNTRVASKQAYTFPKLNNEQAFNYSAFGTLNSPNNSYNFIQGYKKTPQQQSFSNLKLKQVENLENIQKQKIQEAKNLKHAAEVAPYIIPGLGQAMWLGKGIDLATSHASGGKYKSWGNMIDQKTGSGAFIGDLTNPGYYVGAFPKLVGKGLQQTGKLLNNSVKNAYKINPWAFKPNPKFYYRMGEGKKFIDDVLETNKIRVYNEDSYANLREAGKISGIREDGKIVLKAKTFPEADTYWSKGVPLDGRYAPQKYGDYMIEASNDIPFINAVNQKTKQRGFWDYPDINYNNTHAKGSYVKPRQSYDYDIDGNIKPSIGKPLEYNHDLIKLYEPHWLKGYKEIKVPQK